MTTTEWKPKVKGIIDVIPEEADDFELQVKRFRAGEFEDMEFLAFRLRNGVYGQRQANAQMIRVKVPFGGLRSDQLDALGEFAAKYAPLNKGHVTTRENFQYHHVKLEDAPNVMRLLGSVGLTTREACGNTVRNVTACPHAGVQPGEPFDVTPYAAAYARYFVRHPYTQSLPRKVKTAFSCSEQDCSIVLIHDLGLIPRIVNGQKGFKIVVGGGTSIMPKLAPTLVEFAPLDQYLKYAEAVIRRFHFTDELRKNKMKARIKFYIARIGIEEFRKECEREMEQNWAKKSFDPTALLFIEDESLDAPALNGKYAAYGSEPEFKEWLRTNVKPQKQAGYVTADIKISQGDINSKQFHQLADLTRKYAGGRARINIQQNMTLRWVPEKALYEVWTELKKIGFGSAGANEITDVVSCPGTDSCKLGITSSMGLNRAISRTLEEMNITDPLTRKMHIKMSGCPNGCGQHHIASIGFHGAAAKAPGGQVPAYELFLGGSYEDGDTRIGLRVKTKVPSKRVPEALKKVIRYYEANRQPGEEFKNFAARLGPEVFEPLLAEFAEVGELNRETIQEYIDWDKTVKYKLERGEGECAA
ncbi:MAG: nitrite/sulfite reductase [SAR202 cluster bacterium]|nr:nitrite/sulfite reductase [SAR202 cluster bacterium]